MKIGLKLWSVNTDSYLREARRLYAERVFDYLELYIVPGSQSTLPLWKALQDELTLPFVIHAPHSAHGVNLADAAKRESNAKTFDEVRLFADQLDAKHIIVHGGAYPHPSDVSSETAIEELVHQLKTLYDARILLENKPFLPIDDAPIRLVGSTPDEIRRVLTAVCCGFCLDIGHAIASANAHSANWRAWIDEFLSLHPAMFHLSDMQVGSQKDQHLHYGSGSLPLAHIVSLLPENALVSIETVKDQASQLIDFSADVDCLTREVSGFDLYGIHLRPMGQSDLELVRMQRNRPDMMRLMTTNHVITAEETRKWFAQLPSGSRYWMVEWEGKIVGQVNYKELRQGEAESGFIFWDEEFKRGGGTFRAILALYHVAFFVYGLKMLHGVVSAENKAALNVTRFFGFRQTGEKEVNGRKFLLFALSANDYFPIEQSFSKLFI